jgi:hypothetical protein
MKQPPNKNKEAENYSKKTSHYDIEEKNDD